AAQDLAYWIEDIKKLMGITVLMVEHDMKLVAAVSDRVLALADGKVLAVGTPKEVQSHPAVVTAYLGAAAGHPPEDHLSRARVGRSDHT
ncbi:MAG: hypothetical protein ACREC6_09460, partial [Hyphomicrobiaceae bacterium]